MPALSFHLPTVQIYLKVHSISNLCRKSQWLTSLLVLFFVLPASNHGSTFLITHQGHVFCWRSFTGKPIILVCFIISGIATGVFWRPTSPWGSTSFLSSMKDLCLWNVLPFSIRSVVPSVIDKSSFSVFYWSSVSVFSMPTSRLITSVVSSFIVAFLLSR